MKRTFSLVLCLLLLLCACGKVEQSETQSTVNAETPAETAAPETEEKPDLPADLTFGGQSFTFGYVFTPNAKTSLVMEEMTGEALNGAQYTTIESASEMLDVKIQDQLIDEPYPATNTIRSTIAAGDDIFQTANLFCVAVPVLLVDGYLLDYKEVPYLDLSKSYWDQSVNQSLMLGDMRYAAIGDLSITTHDHTFVLLFSKEQILQNNLASHYELVNEGKWTMDAMQEMMETVTVDTNGDGSFTTDDNYGYLATVKHVLPNFWIGSGELTIGLNDNCIPEMSMKDERFVSVIDRIFAMTYDNNARFLSSNGDDVTEENKTLFQEDKGLFMDCSMFWLSAMRTMETDFGIIPYPKFDETQDNYYARISYFMPPLIPITNQNLELTGAVLEVTNYFAKKHITPAYYDIALKGKYSRDEESASMMDLIFENRLIDLGDTIFCANVRDGFFASMYASNNRNLISAVEKNEKHIQSLIDNMVGANQ